MEQQSNAEKFLTRPRVSRTSSAHIAVPPDLQHVTMDHNAADRSSSFFFLGQNQESLVVNERLNVLTILVYSVLPLLFLIFPLLLDEGCPCAVRNDRKRNFLR